MIRFILNDKTVSTGLPPGMVLVDFIRYHKHLTGTKIGCREGDCGACTVLVGKVVETSDEKNDSVSSLQYESMTSCLMPLANAHGKHIVTIEGVNLEGKLNPIQQFMAEEGATQCGFCTPGFVVSFAGYCLNGKDNAVAAVDGNICRCTGYKSIERAAARLERLLKPRGSGDAVEFITKNEILPSYFSEIKHKLRLLQEETAGNGLGANGNEAGHQTFLGGGTDLYVQKHEQMVETASTNIFDVPYLNGIRKEKNSLIIGGAATVTDLKNSSLINNAFPSFQRFARLISSTPIRNMATIAGNFVNASPIGDMTIFFLALNASIDLSENENTRTIPLKDFYKGYKQLAKEPGEILTSLRFDLPGNHSYFNFEKVSKRTHLDIASVNTAIYLELNGATIENCTISAGGVGPVPMILKKTSALLNGKSMSMEIVQELIEMMKTEISPITDTRGSKEYKTLLLAQLIKAHLIPLLQNI